jgi:hypothetical protein
MAPRGPQTQSRERRKFVRRSGSGISLAPSHRRMAEHAGPACAGQGRQPAEPGARSASLDRRRLVRQRLARRNGAARPNRAASLAHCADMLSAKENPYSCKARPCQKSCDNSLHCHTIDRDAPWSLYPAIKRSVVCASPVLALSFAKLRSGKSQAKRPGSRPRADSLHSLCRSLGRSPVRHVHRIDRGKDAGTAAAVPVFADPARDRFANVRYCGERTRERTWRYRRE